MRENKLRMVWQGGDCTLNCWLSSPSSVQAEMIASQGFDSVVVDLQHGYIDYKDVVAIFTAVAASDTVPLVRVPWNDPAWIMKVLDAGAYGVICPMINSRADAETFVKWCRYPPEGERSFGPMRAAMHARTDSVGYFEQANQTVLAIAQIETAEALQNLEHILSVPGLDAVYVGASDLSISHGGPAKIDNVGEKSVERQLHILAAGKEHGTKVCLHATNVDEVRLCVERGADFVTVATDAAELLTGTERTLTASRRIVAEARGTGDAAATSTW